MDFRQYYVLLVKCGTLFFSLPGPEILREPGIKEGQTKFVRESKNVICYSWSLAERMWKKLGNVEAGSLTEKTVFLCLK